MYSGWIIADCSAFGDAASPPRHVPMAFTVASTRFSNMLMWRAKRSVPCSSRTNICTYLRVLSHNDQQCQVVLCIVKPPSSITRCDDADTGSEACATVLIQRAVVFTCAQCVPSCGLRWGIEWRSDQVLLPCYLGCRV